MSDLYTYFTCILQYKFPFINTKGTRSKNKIVLFFYNVLNSLKLNLIIYKSNL